MEKRFFLTFGSNKYLRNHYAVIMANSYSEAREKVMARLGSAWSMLYADYNFQPKFFPAGEWPWHELTQPIAERERYVEPRNTYEN